MPGGKVASLIIALALSLTAMPAISSPRLSDIVAEASSSVVFVWVKDDKGNISTGTGFVVRSNGLVATAQHVIEGWQQISLRFRDGTIKSAVPAWFWRRQDVALLLTSTPVPKPLPLHPGLTSSIYAGLSHEGVRQGDEIVTLGFPLSSTLGYEEITVTRGIVSAFRMEEPAISVVQIDAALNPGNSGGPVLNAQGKVIGLITSKLRSASSIGFAVLASELGFALDSYQNGRFPFDLCFHAASTPTWLCQPTTVVGWEERGQATVPLRDTAMTFGAEVDYDSVTGRIQVHRGDHVLEVTVGSPYILVDNRSINIGQKIESHFARIPLRVLVDALGGRLSFDGRNRMAYVDMP